MEEDKLEIQILSITEERGFRKIKITSPGAVNTPILKFPLTGGTTRRKDIIAVPTGGQQCPIHPNHQLKKDGTCGHSYKCGDYQKVCPVR